MFKRGARVQALLHHEISQYIQKMSSLDMGLITVTTLKLSDDLSDARVFYSVLGSEENKQQAARILRSWVPEMRRVLSRKLESLKKFPSIRFVYDDTPEKAQRVGLILKDLEHESHELGGDSADSPPENSRGNPE